jgi:hypothetical protein
MLMMINLLMIANRPLFNNDPEVDKSSAVLILSLQVLQNPALLQ